MKYVLFTLLAVPGMALAATAPSSAVTLTTVPATVQGSIARGAQRIPMLALDIAVPCNSQVTMHTLTLHHQGRGASTDIERLYAVVDNRRVTRSATVRRDGSSQLQFRGLPFAACRTTRVDILADISPTAAVSGAHAFAILSADDVGVDGASVNVQEATKGAVNVGRFVSPVDEPELTAEFLALPRTLSYGAQRVLAVLRLTGDRSDDQEIQSITFTNKGSARGADVQALSLETLSHQSLTGTVQQLDGDTVLCTFDPPLLLRRSEKRVLQLRGDIRASRKRTIDFRIEEPADIIAGKARSRR